MRPRPQSHGGVTPPSVAVRSAPPPYAVEEKDLPLIPAISSNGTLYPVGKMEAHRRGLLHMAISIFVFSGEELLIQRRAACKYHSGLQWANTCCSHPVWGEAENDAAQRRLKEELGIAVALKPAGTLVYRADVGGGLVEHERIRAYVGYADKTTLRADPDPNEVAAIRWATREQLRPEIAADPRAFAPWFRIYIERWDELGISHAA